MVTRSNSSEDHGEHMTVVVKNQMKTKCVWLPVFRVMFGMTVLMHPTANATPTLDQAACEWAVNPVIQLTQQGLFVGELTSLAQKQLDSLDVSTLAERVYHLLTKEMDRPAKMNLGPPEQTENLKRQIGNFLLAVSTGEVILPRRQRVNLGIPVLKMKGDQVSVTGFWVITLYHQANPNEYERKHMGLTKPFSHLQQRLMAVHPHSRNEGIGGALLGWTLKLSNQMHLPVMSDVLASNEAVQRFLVLHSFKIERRWKTAAGTNMIRFVQIDGDEDVSELKFRFSP